MSECINWRGATNNKGYGHGWFRGYGYMTAHRWAYSINKGDIPAGVIVRHICDNRKCINPEHLILGSYKDNMQDAKLRGRPIGRIGNTSREERIADIRAGLSNEEIARKHKTGRWAINRLRRSLVPR